MNQDKKELGVTPELVKNDVGVAIESLMVGCQFAFDGGIFTLDDAATISAAIQTTARYLKTERFKNSSYGKIMVEYVNAEGHLAVDYINIPWSEPNELTPAIKYRLAVVPEIQADETHKEIRGYFMYSNGQPVQLYPNQELIVVNDQIVANGAVPQVVQALNEAQVEETETV
jgi:hypothetical protein